MNTSSYVSAVAEGANLSVESDETVLLSPDSQRFEASYKRIYPGNIDEVRAIVGLSDASAKALKAHKCCDRGSMPSGLASPEDLTSADPAVSRRAKEIAINAAYQYATGANSNALAQWKPLINKYLEVGKIAISYCLLRDIEIADRGTLVISKATRVLFANNIKIHGSGRMVCKGDISINCVTLQGFRKYLVAPAAVSAVARTI